MDVWQLGKKIALDVYQTTKEFPRDELYGLVSQMRRAALSIPSNIAEGFNRHHNKDYRRFLLVAMGSCAELEAQVEVSFDLKYVSEAALKRLLEKLDHESRMLRNLITRIENRKDQKRPTEKPSERSNSPPQKSAMVTERSGRAPYRP